jgi:hypothetical protein
MLRLILCLCFWLSASAISFGALPVRISEFSAAGRQGLIDDFDETPDWIEIENTSSNAISLEDWSLSDDSREPGKWRFPKTNVPPAAFMIVFASGKDRSVAGSTLHPNFKLKAERGELLLTNPAGETSKIENYPPQLPGVSFGIPQHDTNAIPVRTYLTASTPGRANAQAITLGPRIHSIERAPLQPRNSSERTIITAKIEPLTAAVTNVTLHFRVMFGKEATVEMRDDGKESDASAGDRVYSAALPAESAKRGEIIRYYVTAANASGQNSRWPIFANRGKYSSYEGFLIPDETIQSPLPVYHLFTPNSQLIERRAGRAVLVYNNELYDNVSISEHGQISTNFPKPSFNVEFPCDHRFRYRSDAARVSELKLLANFADKSKIRNTLAYEMIAAAGSIGHFAFPIRLQHNGQFFCVLEAVEDGDDRWLERVGLDPQGALYKMYGNLAAIDRAEKKTRKHEDRSDLATLAEALAEDRPLPGRVAYTLENVNIPQCISYLVALTIISSGDHGHKNYYLYRDTRGSREWSLLPWDVDLSWGRTWTKTYFDDNIYFDAPLSLYRAGGPNRGRNPLYNVFLDHAPFRQMYLRRLRTVLDELLPEKNSPAATRLRELRDLIASDAELDNQRWPTWAPNRSARAEADRIISIYLPKRRTFLLTEARLHGEKVPDAQPGTATVRIIEARADFIRIANENDYAVDVSRWKLSGRGIEHQFRPGTVIPPKDSLLIIGDIRKFRAGNSAGAKHQFLQGDWIGALQASGTLRVEDPHKRIVTEFPQ